MFATQRLLFYFAFATLLQQGPPEFLRVTAKLSRESLVQGTHYRSRQDSVSILVRPQRVPPKKRIKADNEQRSAANGTFDRGEQLHREGSVDSLREAVKNYEQAIARYKIKGDSKGQARALSEIGQVYDDLG